MFIAIIILTVVSIFFSLTKGSTDIHLNHPLYKQILWEIRLPRTFSAFITGGLLAMAGVIMQVLLRNPLADPYVLGVSSGAAVTALICLLLGLSGFWLTSAAWLGSLSAMGIVLFLTKKNAGHDMEAVLLTGVALTSGLSALTSFILMITPNNTLHSMLFWLLGDLSFSHQPFAEGIILFVASIMSLSLAAKLNVLTRGNEEAQSLGLDLKTLHKQLFVLGSILTATAVALAGCIGFIGLIVPHVLRLLGFYDHRWLIPTSVLVGGTLLTTADTLSRTLFAPQQLPVGMIMALLGIPIFIWLLHKKNPA